ncbi:hypothetical protein PanWU01x14_117080 [Parasponia andersonii]|uniref:Uncharacterized protein n=1 Tax=Parasponia andersonii TaxID=3476 RepID=A0A2P5CWG3_PARAD|nr:hypothetical protein PanWU01x14_117080 [Parasponia andersonii]
MSATNHSYQFELFCLIKQPFSSTNQRSNQPSAASDGSPALGPRFLKCLDGHALSTKTTRPSSTCNQFYCHLKSAVFTKKKNAGLPSHSCQSKPGEHHLL